MSTRLADTTDLDTIAAQIRAAGRIALDTEFHAERRHTPKLLLVQIAVAGDVWIVDPLRPGHVGALAEALLSVPWVVHGGEHDLTLMRIALGGLPERVVDTQIGAGLVSDDFPAPLSRLQQEWLDRPAPPAQSLSDWGKRPLSETQLAYAAEDAAVLLPLWDAIEGRLRERGRLELAEAACAEALERGRSPAAIDEGWRSVRGVRHLDPAQITALQELCAWREQTARGQNTPPWSIATDGVLLHIAKRLPLTVERMSDRRVPGGLVKRHGEALLGCIRRAQRRPEWGRPRVCPARGPLSLQLDWLLLWGRTCGALDQWAPRLVLPEELAERLLLESPTTEDAIEAIVGWRLPLLAEGWLTASTGRLGLAISASTGTECRGIPAE